MLFTDAIDTNLSVTSMAAVVSLEGKINNIMLNIDVATEDIINKMIECAFNKLMIANINKTVK